MLTPLPASTAARIAAHLVTWTVLALAVLAAVGTPASAHPLGNVSVNHLTEVSISEQRIDVRYVLDQAEAPTFVERDLSDAQIVDRKREEIERGLEVIVDGRPVTLRPDGDPQLTFPEGEAGLRTSRIELSLTAKVDRPRGVEVRDDTFADLTGYKAIVARPGEGTAVTSSVPSEDPTDGLRSYPPEVLEDPPQLTRATFDVAPGAGTVDAPAPDLSADADAGAQPPRSENALTSVFEDAAAGRGVLVFLIATAFGWGALHALSPGHGKAMVAGYLIGTRGDARHAVALGATVTATHTAGVFALGLVTLLLAEYVLPEDLYPWLTLASGILVITVGLGVLRSRMRSRGDRLHPDAGRVGVEEESESPAGDHHAHHHHGHHGHHHHDHDHSHLTWKGVLGMGASAGLIPCPSALVVLLAAISQHQVGLGLLLIVAFSLGLAGTLTALGLGVVYAGRATSRLDFLSSRIGRLLPVLSTVAIVLAGVVLTAQAIPQVL